MGHTATAACTCHRRDPLLGAKVKRVDQKKLKWHKKREGRRKYTTPLGREEEARRGTHTVHRERVIRRAAGEVLLEHFCLRGGWNKGVQKKKNKMNLSLASPNRDVVFFYVLHTAWCFATSMLTLSDSFLTRAFTHLSPIFFSPTALCIAAACGTTDVVS